jgi:hypothetical protein
MLKTLPLVAILLATSLVSCKKEEAPIQDATFEIKYSSDGMDAVETQLGLNEKSQKDPTRGRDILTYQLSHALDAKGYLADERGTVRATGRVSSGDQLHVYVSFKDITNPTNSGPSGNGFLAAALYINGQAMSAVRLGDYERHHNAELRVVDSSGKTNLLKEITVTVP